MENTISIINYSRDELLALALDTQGAEARDAVEERLALGRRIAVYENVDLGHPDLGHCVFLTWGSPEALIEVEDWRSLPKQCPVQLPHGLMHWRYYLKGAFHG